MSVVIRHGHIIRVTSDADAPHVAEVRRRMLSGAIEVPRGQEATYKNAFPAMLRLLKALHDARVRTIPGTDSLSGYALHHELEQSLGITPTSVHAAARH